MAAGDCLAALARLSVYAYRSGLSIYAALRGDADASAAAEAARACQGLDVVAAPYDAISLDAALGVYGEMLAYPLLSPPQELVGSMEGYVEHLTLYLARATKLMMERLESRLGEAARGASAPPIAAAAFRASDLARLYPWLTPRLNEALELLAHGWARDVHAAILRRLGWVESRSGLLQLPPAPPTLTVGAASRVEAEALEIQLSPARLAQASATPPHPLIRDPWMLIHLRRGRLATKLVPWRRQLVRLWARRPIVLKRYRAATSVPAWLAGAAEALGLPAARTNARARMAAELTAAARLLDAGLPAPEPLLVEHRRLEAALAKPLSPSDVATLADAARSKPSGTSYPAALGELLASTHRVGVALWSPLPGSILVGGSGEVAPLTLEQARSANSLEVRAWDVAVAAYSQCMVEPGHAHSRAAALAAAYASKAGWEPVLEAAKPKYMAPFAAVAPPASLEKVRRTLLAMATRKNPSEVS